MLKELVRKNRSVRGYSQERRMTREDLLDLADCARLSASSVNKQPLKYYLAWEEEEVDRIQSLTSWARGLPELHLPHPGMCPTAYIVILQDREISDDLQRYQKDCGIVAQTMLLRAVEMGFGGCMIGNFRAAAVRETLGLSERFAPLLLVALGQPAETIVLTEAAEGESVAYYRDENDIHYVPKRRLADIVLTKDRVKE